MSFGLSSISAQDITTEAQGGGGLQIIPGQYIVQLKDKPSIDGLSTQSTERPGEGGVMAAGTANTAKVKSVQAKGGIKSSSVLLEFGNAMVGFTAKLSPQEVSKLKSDPNVEGVYPDYKILSEPAASQLQSNEVVGAASQTVSCGVTKAGGPADGSTKSTWIWVLSTGIDYNHPDLNVQTNPTYAKSFIEGQTIMDGHGHGTHLAGIAAAKNNTIGVVGISAGATVVPVKVLNNSGSGSFSGVIAGLNHVMSKKIAGDVVLLPIGAYGMANCENSNPILRDIIRNLGNAGVWVVMPAGGSSDINGATKTFPGCINGTRVLTVGAINCNYTCSSYSNWGKPPVDWAAVGEAYYSTYKGGGYTTMSGTSMSAALVAGICHARTTGPISAGNVNCGGMTYPIARR